MVVGRNEWFTASYSFFISFTIVFHCENDDASNISLYFNSLIKSNFQIFWFIHNSHTYKINTHEHLIIEWKLINQKKSSRKNGKKKKHSSKNENKFINYSWDTTNRHTILMFWFKVEAVISLKFNIHTIYQFRFHSYEYTSICICGWLVTRNTRSFARKTKENRNVIYFQSIWAKCAHTGQLIGFLVC